MRGRLYLRGGWGVLSFPYDNSVLRCVLLTMNIKKNACNLQLLPVETFKLRLVLN